MIRKPKRSNPRDNIAYREMCTKVRRRDKNRCQMPECGSTKNTQVHHIRRYADNPVAKYSTFNTIVLCSACHTKVTNKEDIYAPLLLRIAAQNEANKK